MFSPRVIVGMCVVVVTLSAAASEAEAAHRGRGRGRGGPHTLFVAPHVAQPGFVARPFRRAHFGPAPWYRPVDRPGLSVGIFIGLRYRYRYPYAYRHAYPYAYSNPAPAAVYAVPPPGALWRNAAF